MPDMNAATEGGATPAPERGRIRRPAPAGAASGCRRSPAFVLWSFTATTFLSALLLFSVQPMFAKMVLPVLGGSPSVWAVAVFFFQAALLAGYCYAHLLIARALHAADGRDPSGRVPAGVSGTAHRAARGLERAADGRALSVADRAVHGGDRPAVPRRVGQCSAAAGLVRPHRPSARARSLFPVRGEQPGQPDRAAGLSLHPRAGVRAARAQPAVDAGLRCCWWRRWRWSSWSCAPARASWAARRRRLGRLGRGRSRCRRGRPAEVDGSPGLDRPGAGALGAAHGLHHPCDDRRRLRAAAVGAAALALPAHLRAGVPRQAADPAHGAAVSCIWPPWPSPCSRCRRPSTRPGS